MHIARCANDVQMNSSWWLHTHAVYNTYIALWRCCENGISHDVPDVVQTANFLADMFNNDASYSAISSVLCALSAYLSLLNGYSVRSHPAICKLVKGVFEKDLCPNIVTLGM